MLQPIIAAAAMHRLARLALVLACLSGPWFLAKAGHDAQPEGGTKDERILVKQVLERLLNTRLLRQGVAGQYVWPPQMLIVPNSATTAQARIHAVGLEPQSKKVLTQLRLTEGFLAKIVDEKDDILAAVLSHELAHLLKQHVVYPPNKEPFSRAEEMAADLEGVKLALAAGFEYRHGIRTAFQAWKALGDFKNFEGLKADHPAWDERLRFLDREEPALWKAMAAFEEGYFFLHAEQYRTAETCFQSVVDNFPDCAEAWANLGYACLMQYCDALELNDLQGFGIGQFAAGCFYTRPTGLAPVRQIDSKMWGLAVAALQTALRRDSSLVLAKANLGLAHLVHPDGKAKAADALIYLEDAAAGNNKGLDELGLSATLINCGVAHAAQGKHHLAATKFERARRILDQAKASAIGIQARHALLNNEALAASRWAGDKRKAFDMFQDYLTQASPSALWWPLAYEQYEKLGAALNQKCVPRATLAQRHKDNQARIVSAVKAGDAEVALSGSLKELLKRLGKEDLAGIPVFHRALLKRYAEIAPGLDVLARDNILAIYLTSAKAPAIVVQDKGLGGKKKEFRVGADATEVQEHLKDQLCEVRSFDNPALTYLFLPDVGVAFRSAGGRIAEIVVTQVPRKLAR